MTSASSTLLHSEGFQTSKSVCDKTNISSKVSLSIQVFTWCWQKVSFVGGVAQFSAGSFTQKSCQNMVLSPTHSQTKTIVTIFRIYSRWGIPFKAESKTKVVQERFVRVMVFHVLRSCKTRTLPRIQLYTSRSARQRFVFLSTGSW